MTGGIEVTPNGDIIVSGAAGVAFYDVVSMRAALGLEIRTGMVMKAGYSLVNACIKRGYVPEGVRRKRDAYGYLNALAVSLGAEDQPL
jgi:hypothetical protein